MEFLELNNSDIYNICSYIRENFKDNNQIISMYQSPDVLKMRMDNNIEVGILCKIDNEIVGIITAITTNKKNYWAIIVLFVDEEHRNKGIGKKLIQEMEKYICKEFLSDYKINISVAENNNNTISLFESTEYMSEGKIRGLTSDDNIVILGKIVHTNK